MDKTRVLGNDHHVSPHLAINNYRIKTINNNSLKYMFTPCSRWTPEEHRLFLQGIMMYGKDWKSMQPLIKTRTLVQIRTHAQKVFKKVGLKRIEKNMSVATLTNMENGLDPSGQRYVCAIYNYVYHICVILYTGFWHSRN